MATIERDRVARVREFNRFYTAVIGVLGEGHLETPYSLTEARVLYELAQSSETEVLDLRRRLDIDAGYLSRLLARFDSAGLVTRDRSATDGRRQVITLTPQGREQFSLLDSRSTRDVSALLDALDTARRDRVVAAMDTIQSELTRPDPTGPRPREVVIRDPRPGDLGWVIERNAVLYAREYGWDETYEVLVARIVTDYAENRDPEREAAWIAELDGERAGAIFCVRADTALLKNDETAKLRLLLVEPAARGAGVGTKLVDTCLAFAKDAGYRRITLWTNDILGAARRIYERVGFTLDSVEPHHSFGHDLVGQYWSRDL